MLGRSVAILVVLVFSLVLLIGFIVYIIQGMNGDPFRIAIGIVMILIVWILLGLFVLKGRKDLSRW